MAAISGPQLRLILRAVLVGVVTFAERLQASSSWDKSLVEGAIVAAVLAGAEAFTPLNAVVGVGKTPPTP